MCCDGTLFNRVTVGPDDDEQRLIAVGIPIVSSGDERHFLQPCTAFGGGCCSAYDDRPRICRNYRCDLLVRYEDDGVDADEAQRIVALATGLRDRTRASIRRVLGPTAPTAIGEMQAAVRAGLPDDPETMAERTQFLLDLASLSVVLRRHFWTPPPTAAAPETTP
jgi:uncharacterized protein